MSKSSEELKKKLRQFYIKKRNTLSSKTVSRKSQKITKKVLDLSEIKEKNNISCYLPINNEVETKIIINSLLRFKKNVLVPCCFKKDWKYNFAKFINWQGLEQNKHGILQPKNPKVVDSSGIEIAILPGLAFSKTGVRLGYGKGVFDKLLSKTNALKIGLAYDFQVVDVIPREQHDLLMNFVITEKTIYSIDATAG